jgi:hypothetical protein
MRVLPLILVGAFALGACGDDSSTVADGDSDTGSTTAVASAPCPDETVLNLENAEDLTGFSGAPVDVSTGPIDVVTDFADGTSGNATLVFADYTIDADPQFGLSAPVGDPQAPDGGLIFTVSITTGGEGDLAVGDYRALEPGEGAVSSPADLTDPDASIPDISPSVNFQTLYLGSERILIGDHSVTLTEVTEDRLCGEITGDTLTNELQVDGQPIVTGRFVIDRV